MHPKLHVRFGGRAGETHQLKSRKGAPVRPLHLCSDLVGLRVCGVGDRCLLAVRRRMASIQQRTNRPGSRRSRTSNLGPATGHSRPRPEAGSSLRRRQPIPVHPLHQPADGSRHLTVGRLSRRLPATTPSRSPSSASTRQNSSEPRDDGGTGTKSSTPPSSTWTGSTTEDSSNQQDTSHQQKGGQLPSSTKASPPSVPNLKFVVVNTASSDCRGPDRTPVLPLQVTGCHERVDPVTPTLHNV